MVLPSAQIVGRNSSLLCGIFGARFIKLNSQRKAVGGFGGNRPETPGLPVDLALEVLVEKFGIVKDMFHGFDYSGQV